MRDTKKICNKKNKNKSLSHEKSKRLKTNKNDDEKDFEEKTLEIEEKKINLARDQFEEGKKMKDIEFKDKLLRTCMKLSNDGIPNNTIYKMHPEFCAMMQCDLNGIESESDDETNDKDANLKNDIDDDSDED